MYSSRCIWNAAPYPTMLMLWALGQKQVPGGQPVGGQPVELQLCPHIAPRVIFDCHRSEGASKNRTQIPIIHMCYLFSALTRVTIGYYHSRTLHSEQRVGWTVQWPPVS